MQLDIFIATYNPSQPRRRVGHFALFRGQLEDAPLYLASATCALIEQDIRAGQQGGALWDPAYRELIEWELS